MERKQLLIGARNILTSAFVAKAEQFLGKEKAEAPLIKDTTHKPVIYGVKNDFDYELRLNSPDLDVPEELTYRQTLDEYHDIWHSENKPLTLGDYNELYYEHGISPRDIDEPAEVLDDYAVKSGREVKDAKKESSLVYF